MKKQVPALAAAGGVFAVFGYIGYRAQGAIGATGWLRYVVTGSFLVITVALAVLTLLFLRARVRAKQDAEAASGCEDIDQAFAAAEKHLGAARLAKETRIGRLPLMLVVGPSGSTKTSVLTHCGLEPELLAGEVTRADAVVATDPLNLWYAQGIVVVEAGGRLLDDEKRWRRLMHHVRPSRVAAAFGRRQQPARFAVLCVGCDEFQKPGASQNLASAARVMRTRLGEAAQLLGIRLPVYVLFTRADRLPYFTEYVRSFTAEEAQQVLGATLPVAAETGGAWAERESRRLNDAFARIVRALTARRLDVLMRESEEATRAVAYEFPRELRRITEPAVQLLIDIFKPSQLSVHAFLRGFYFTGVRPIILRDLAAQNAPQPSAPSLQAGATQVFNAAAMLQQVQQVPVIGPSGRKVPQWVFVERLFREVMLADRTAATITGGGARVDLLRRSLVGGVAAAAIVTVLGFTVSYGSNRAMVKRSSSVATAAAALQPGDVRAELIVLDSLREQLVQLRGHSALLAGWFLSRHDPARRELRRLYFEKFQQTMWGGTRDRMVAYLQALPESPAPNSNFKLAHDALAGYMLTTDEWKREEPELLAEAAMSFWRPDISGDSVNAIARAQFQFFGEELPLGNPYAVRADPVIVARSQRFIRQFGRNAFYESLVAEIGREVETVRWLEGADVRNRVTVSGAYTPAGWGKIKERLGSLDEFIKQREWLYGAQGPEHRPHPDSLLVDYGGHYIAAWQRFIDNAEIVPFGSAPEGANRLAALGSPGSPLFRMLQTVADNTKNDELPTVQHAFAPLHAAVPPRAEGGPTARVPGYVGILNSLSQQLRAAATPGADATMVQTVALQLSAEVTNIGRVESMNANAAQTQTLLHELLRQPERRTSDVLTQLGPAAANGAGAAFCSSYAALQGRYPFNRRGADADVDAVAAMFKKDDGDFAVFRNETLAPYVTPAFTRVAGAPQVTRSVLDFLKAGAGFSEGLFGDGGQALNFSVLMVGYPQGLTEAILEIEGASRVVLVPNEPMRKNVFWPLGQPTRARLILRIRGSEVTIPGDPPSPSAWALFRLFDTGTWSAGQGGRHAVRWSVPGQSDDLELSVGVLGNVPQVLYARNTDALARCPQPLVGN